MMRIMVSRYSSYPVDVTMNDIEIIFRDRMKENTIADVTKRLFVYFKFYPETIKNTDNFSNFHFIFANEVGPTIYSYYTGDAAQKIQAAEDIFSVLSNINLCSNTSYQSILFDCWIVLDSFLLDSFISSSEINTFMQQLIQHGLEQKWNTCLREMCAWFPQDIMAFFEINPEEKTSLFMEQYRKNLQNTAIPENLLKKGRPSFEEWKKRILPDTFIKNSAPTQNRISADSFSRICLGPMVEPVIFEPIKVNQ